MRASNKLLKIKLFTIGFIIAGSTIALSVKPLAAAPAIASISGTISNGSTITIQGSGFGTKNPAPPLVWADFESGINPTNLGINTSWNGIQNMQWSSNCLIGNCVEASDGSGVWTLWVNYNSWTNPGQKFYIYKLSKMNFLITDSTQNWKSWRMWPSGGSGNYPNIYIAPSNGRIYVEGIGVESGYWASTANIRVNTTNWITEEIIGQASSLDVKDGSLIVRYDGVTVANGTILTRSTAAPDYMVRNHIVHGVIANQPNWNPAWNSNNRYWADDVYVDTTWSRILVGDAPTYNGCTKLSIQIPLTWTDTSITMIINKGRFSSLDNVYLYVIDANNNANVNGYPLCPQCPKPPLLQLK